MSSKDHVLTTKFVIFSRSHSTTINLVDDTDSEDSESSPPAFKRLCKEKENSERLAEQNALLAGQNASLVEQNLKLQAELDQAKLDATKNRDSALLLKEELDETRQNNLAMGMRNNALERVFEIYVPIESITDKFSQHAADVVIHCVETGKIQLDDMFDAFTGLGDVAALFVSFAARLGTPMYGVPVIETDSPGVVLGKSVQQWSQNDGAKFFLAAIIVTHKDMFYDVGSLEQIAHILGVQGAKAAIKRLQVACAVDKASELVKAVVLPANQVINDASACIKIK